MHASGIEGGTVCNAGARLHVPKYGAGAPTRAAPPSGVAAMTYLPVVSLICITRMMPDGALDSTAISD